ncbi:MAG TPA: molecular chaperone DnaK, partial [Candidatus Hydrogenedentes bacterium]|nr:molecular chaperone DnaK [Candidatus Hydrogenedentota bacterium]
KIRIESSSGLSEDEIERMVKEAEVHADEDKVKRKEIETRNNADTLLYTTEKTLREHGDKISETDKKNIEDACAELRKALEGSDIAAIEAASKRVTDASHKLAEAMYAAASQQRHEAGGAAGPEYVHPEGESTGGGKSDTVDADFTVVDDDKKNN